MQISEVLVYKFGGSSIKDASGYERIAHIIQQANAPLVVVLSAMGKTTNALEEVVQFIFNKDLDAAHSRFERIRQEHLEVIFELELGEEVASEFNALFDDHWKNISAFQGTFDELYDRSICLGELSSTRIMRSIVQKNGEQLSWLDARKLIATNGIHRDATVDWDITKSQVDDAVIPKLMRSGKVITQGFIGGHNGEATSLGREGSDYSAAIFAYTLEAKELTIWKDVPGILTGDPRQFDNVLKVDRLSYQEAIEMTYYGAKVIHPKTIKPLQNKGIRLHVRPFLTPEEEGTIITHDVEVSYPPIVVVEENQCLVHISTRDFSFVAEHHMSIIFDKISKHRLKVNMMRNTAISFTVCLTNGPRRLAAMVEELSQLFDVVVDQELELITIRHGSDQGIQDIVGNRIVIFEERIRDTVQMVVRKSPGMKRKEVS